MPYNPNQPPPTSKQTQQGPIVNLSAKMDARQNNETMEADPNQTGIKMTNLINGDLFNTHSLSSRLGVADIGGGVINASGNTYVLYDMQTPSGTFINQVLFIQDQYFDRTGILIANSGTNNIYSGRLFIQETSNAATQPLIGGDLSLVMHLDVVNALTYPPSGIGGISSGRTSTIDNIALSGFYYDNSNPLNLSWQRPNGVPYSQDCKAEAISAPTVFNLGAFSGTSGNWATAVQEIDWTMCAPYQMQDTFVYFLKPVVNNVSGNALRALQTQMLFNSGTEIKGNIVTAQERINSGVPNELFIGTGYGLPTKTYMYGEDYSYPTPTYALVDYPCANTVMSVPLSGASAPPGIPSTNIWVQANNGSNTNVPFPGLTITPTDVWFHTQARPTASITTPSFGNLITVPSGIHNINGAYVMMGIFSGNGYTPYTINKTSFPITGYNVNYTCSISTIASVSGGNITPGTVLATYSGNHIFDNPYTYVAPQSAGGANWNPSDPSIGWNATQTSLDKVYAIFDNPIVVNNTGTQQYLITWSLSDSSSGGPLTDYMVATQNRVVGGPGTVEWWWAFSSPIILGMTNNPTFINDYFVVNDMPGIYRPYQTNATQGNLACGIVSIPNDNAITDIYDYRRGDTRTQQIMYAQGNTVGNFLLNSPTNRNILWNGATIGDNYKWTNTTSQNMWFGNHYSQDQGVCWDQIFSGNSITHPKYGSLQQQGLQPVFSGLYSTITNLPSGSTLIPSGSEIKIILATQIDSGGLRASNILTVNSSSGNTIKISGIASSNNDATYPFDMFHVYGQTGVSGQSQYNFDVNSNGTYVFATQPSGSVFFLAPLCDSSGNIIPNPLPNVNTWNTYTPFASGTGPGVYIFDVSFSGVNAQQVPNIINYNQDYLVNQVPTPKFKKTLVFKNLFCGIGDVDNPSRIWFSEQGPYPQIWGVDTSFYGYYDIDPDNGQEITGMEIYKDYLIIFKENSTYTAAYTATAGNPFDIHQISNVLGNIGAFTTVQTDLGVFGLSSYGPILATYYGVSTIGDEIFPYYQQLDHNDLIYAVAIHDVNRQQIYWSISNSKTSVDNQTGLIYSYPEKSWGIRQNGIWNVGNRIGDADNFQLLYIGDTLGQIKQLDVTNADQDILFTDTTKVNLTKNINLSFTTPWLNFGNSQHLKQIKSMRINCGNSKQKLKVDIYTDQNDSAPKYTRYLNMSVPVINRVVSLAGTCRTLKIVVNSVGTPDLIKINSLQLSFIDLGPSINI